MTTEEHDFKSGEVSCSDSSTCSKSTSSSSKNSTSTTFQPIIVQHRYQDHANDSLVTMTAADMRKNRGGVAAPFPQKLYEMLEMIDEEQDIVSWQPHGRCFKIHKAAEFKTIILPKYFPNLSKMASFQRQLNLYGFKRLAKHQSLDKGGYYHELFLRGRPDLIHSLQRTKVKGTGIRARSNPDQEPDFWSMAWVNENDKNSSSRNSSMKSQAMTVTVASPPVAAPAQSSSTAIQVENTKMQAEPCSTINEVGPLQAPSMLGAPPSAPLQPLMPPLATFSSLHNAAAISREASPALAPLPAVSSSIPQLTVSEPVMGASVEVPLQNVTYSSTAATVNTTTAIASHDQIRNTAYTSTSYDYSATSATAPALVSSSAPLHQPPQIPQYSYRNDEVQTQYPFVSASSYEQQYSVDEVGMTLFQQQPYEMYDMDIETLVDEFFNTRDDTDFATMLEKAVA